MGVITIDKELRVLGMGCESLRKRFYTSCRWCNSFIDKWYATVLRKGEWAGPNGEVTMRSYFHKLVWKSTSKASGSSGGSSHSGMQAFAMDEIEDYYGMAASSEWYDGPDDI